MCARACTHAHWAYSTYVRAHTGRTVHMYVCTLATVRSMWERICALVQMFAVRARMVYSTYVCARAHGVQYICTCAHWAYSSYVCVHTGHCTQHVGAYLCTRANVCCARTHGVQYICVRARAWAMAYSTYVCVCARKCLLYVRLSQAIHSKKGVSAETCRRMKAAGASSPVRRITAATSRHGTDPRLCPVVT